jgi:Subtilase family
VTFFVRLSLAQLRALVTKVDCVFGYDLAPPDILTWRLLSEPPTRKDLESFRLSPPQEEAPAVVILDSGVALEHQLLKPAILGASSILPGIDSPADAHGHGTKMAGAALYAGELAGALTRGEHSASHWIQSVRVLVRPREGTASEENREYWPRFTSDAVLEAEKIDARTRQRAFVLAVTYPIEPLTPSTYSQAADQLAFHDGKGRLLIVSAGNVAPADLFEASSTYPGGVLLRKIQEPAQGSNVLTVGAYTGKTRLPPEPAYAEASTVAPEGGISPHTTSGRVDAPWPIKPEIVLEGGNVALGTSLADPGVDTLVTLTTGHDVLRAPLAQINATSEASARAAHMAASIWRENPTLRPETVRGLLVHSASWTAAMRQQFSMPDRLYACGYGVPDVEWAQSCAEDRATVIVEDEMPNSIAVQRPKNKPPKRPTTPTVEEVDVRWMKVFRMPMPDEKLLANPDAPVQLRVTLSYLPEPSTFRTRVEYGLRLKWDMQGPLESEAEFLERIDDLHRPRGTDGKRVKKDYKDSFDWDIGIQRRSRGTMQSDRWSGKASLLAGTKLIAVVPVLGWWDRRADMKNRAQPFSLMVSVFADDIYSSIEAALPVPVPIEVG